MDSSTRTVGLPTPRIGLIAICLPFSHRLSPPYVTHLLKHAQRTFRFVLPYVAAVDAPWFLHVLVLSVVSLTVSLEHDHAWKRCIHTSSADRLPGAP